MNGQEDCLCAAAHAPTNRWLSCLWLSCQVRSCDSLLACLCCALAAVLGAWHSRSCQHCHAQPAARPTALRRHQLSPFPFGKLPGKASSRQSSPGLHQLSGVLGALTPLQLLMHGSQWSSSLPPPTHVKVCGCLAHDTACEWKSSTLSLPGSISCTMPDNYLSYTCISRQLSEPGNGWLEDFYHTSISRQDGHSEWLPCLPILGTSGQRQRGAVGPAAV